MRVYEQAGFRRMDTYERITPAGMGEFHCMVWQDKPAGRLRASLHTPLKRIADTLNRHGVDWGLGGSALLALHGLADAPPADLDLLVDAAHAERAQELLAELGEYRELAPKAPFYTRYFSRYEVEGASVDLMGLFSIRHAEGTYRWDWKARHQAGSTSIQGVRVPLASLEDWYAAYSLIPGKQHKAARIERHWCETGGCSKELWNEILQRELPRALRARIEALLEELA